jgi:hypothetical protein
MVRCQKIVRADRVATARPAPALGLENLFDLVLPVKVQAAVAKRDVKMIFDPVTNDLIQIDMPLYTRFGTHRLTLNNGWITEASVEDVKLLPGVRKTIFRFIKPRTISNA